MLDDRGVEHLRNPLGGRRCLGCREVFPCPTAAAGEQLALDLASVLEHHADVIIAMVEETAAAAAGEMA